MTNLKLIAVAERLWEAGISAVVAKRQAKGMKYPRQWLRCCDNLPSRARQEEFNDFV